MDFRSLAFLTIWTLISGPIFSLPVSPASSEQAKPSVQADKPLKTVKPAR